MFPVVLRENRAVLYNIDFPEIQTPPELKLSVQGHAWNRAARQMYEREMTLTKSLALGHSISRGEGSHSDWEDVHCQL